MDQRFAVYLKFFMYIEKQKVLVQSSVHASCGHVVLLVYLGNMEGSLYICNREEDVSRLCSVEQPSILSIS